MGKTESSLGEGIPNNKPNMEVVSKECLCTVQGVGCPTAASVKGEKVGSRTSLSNDCCDSEVDHLASVVFGDKYREKAHPYSGAWCAAAPSPRCMQNGGRTPPDHVSGVEGDEEDH